MRFILNVVGGLLYRSLVEGRQCKNGFSNPNSVIKCKSRNTIGSMDWNQFWRIILNLFSLPASSRNIHYFTWYRKHAGKSFSEALSLVSTMYKKNLKKSLSYFWQERHLLWAQQHTCQKDDEDFSKQMWTLQTSTPQPNWLNWTC